MADAVACTDKSEDAPEVSPVPSMTVSSDTAALGVDDIAKLRDEDVTVEMLLAYATKLQVAEEKIRELKQSSVAKKRKAADDVPGQLTSNKAAKGDKTGKGVGVVTAKRRELIIKKVMTACKQSIKGVKFFEGYYATAREAKAQELISKAEFDSVFNGGTLIQPTVVNKPCSKVTIREYSAGEAKELLGSAADALKGQLWEKGGAPSPFLGMWGGGGGFAKGKKRGSTALNITSMKVAYSANVRKLSVVMSVINAADAS